MVNCFGGLVMNNVRFYSIIISLLLVFGFVDRNCFCVKFDDFGKNFR